MKKRKIRPVVVLATAAWLLCHVISWVLPAIGVAAVLCGLLTGIEMTPVGISITILVGGLVGTMIVGLGHALIITALQDIIEDL